MTNDRRNRLNNERASTLIPELRDILLDGISNLEDNGWFPLVVQAHRSIETQDALYAQGRESLDTVNKLRAIAGLDPILEDENSRIVTSARGGKSKHNYGKAFDLVNYPENSGAEWNNLEFYNAANDVFEPNGLSWGGYWKKQDLPHWEME